MKVTPLGDGQLFKPEHHDGRFILTSQERLSTGQIIMRGEQAFQNCSRVDACGSHKNGERGTGISDSTRGTFSV